MFLKNSPASRRSSIAKSTCNISLGSSTRNARILKAGRNRRVDLAGLGSHRSDKATSATGPGISAAVTIAAGSCRGNSQVTVRRNIAGFVQVAAPAGTSTVSPSWAVSIAACAACCEQDLALITSAWTRIMKIT